jgi:hypothetical protein
MAQKPKLRAEVTRARCARVKTDNTPRQSDEKLVASEFGKARRKEQSMSLLCRPFSLHACRGFQNGLGMLPWGFGMAFIILNSGR